ncbi:P-loop containing nucleoside triphosphate hydrolase protein [Pyrenochaeta sp. MPI-SDFR-AT-0127]|nr:P-loop containing nucleoside triphosphate hydrolase protein [Pyrenochaeta sp. MPI-SDFR-AT-0127]
MKFVFVGDGACGKTTFMIVASTGEFPREYIPTVFENYSSNHILDGVMFHLGLWDTAGQEDYDRLRPLSYPQTDMFCICYSIGSPAMFDSVAKKWSPEVDYHNGEVGAAKVLLGFQKDLRHDPSLIASLKRQGRKPVTKAEGEKLAKQIGAVAFLECSALTRDGVGEIFPTLLGMVLEANPGLKSKYSIHQKQQRSIRRIFAKP